MGNAHGRININLPRFDFEQPCSVWSRAKVQGVKVWVGHKKQGDRDVTIFDNYFDAHDFMYEHRRRTTGIGGPGDNTHYVILGEVQRIAWHIRYNVLQRIQFEKLEAVFGDDLDTRTDDDTHSD